jgi:hypothetical protein
MIVCPSASVECFSTRAQSFDEALPIPGPPVLEGYRAALNTPHGPRALGTVLFADWMRARESPLAQSG